MANNPFEGRLPPGWQVLSASKHDPRSFTVIAPDGERNQTHISPPFTVNAILRGIWVNHLIPGVKRDPGNLGLRRAGFSKHWRLPEAD